MSEFAAPPGSQAGARLRIRRARPGDEAALHRYYLDNASHLAPWEPLRAAGYHSLDAWRQRLLDWEREQAEGRAACFIALDERGAMLASCNLSNIIHGAFRACTMGYSVDARQQGRGIMKATCLHAIDLAFGELRLNRIQAAYLPRNTRSAGLLARLGFEKEGLARRYLQIAGRWEDHVITALLNPRPPD